MPNTTIKEINIHNKIISDKHQMDNKFNEYFTNIGRTLDNKIPHVNGDHLQFIKTFSGDSMFIMPTDKHEIKRITGDLLSRKSPGQDDISPKVVKSTSDLISPAVCDIFNKSFLQGRFSNKLKLARVVPIYKSDNRTLLTNYRLISVLPVFSKILEKNHVS